MHAPADREPSLTVPARPRGPAEAYPLLPPATALELVLRHARRLEAEPVDATESLGRVLAEDVRSGEDYPAHPRSVHTIGVDNMLVCSNDLDEDFVYELTKSLFNGLPALAAEQTSLRLMDVSQGPATPIPLHDGAARYYRERELFR